MTLEDKINSTAPCGLDCFNCLSHESKITEETRSALSEFFKKDKAEVGCSGCRSISGQCMFTGDCPTYKCVQDKGLNYCFECDEFPCLKIAPAADGAGNFPQNFKVYNLCRIKAIGVERWITEEADDIRSLYFNGKFIPGAGVMKK